MKPLDFGLGFASIRSGVFDFVGMAFLTAKKAGKQRENGLIS